MSAPQHANQPGRPRQPQAPYGTPQPPVGPWYGHGDPQPGQPPGPGLHGSGGWAPPPVPPGPSTRRKILTGVLIVVVVLAWLAACGAILDGGGETAAPAAAPSAGATSAAAPSPAPQVTRSPDRVVTVTIAPPDPPSPTFKKITAREWGQIVRNPDAHAGEAYVVYGYVTQADAATGDEAIRASVDGVRHRGEYGWLDYEDNTMLSDGGAPGFADLVNDDIFQAHVVVLGSFDYETALGGETTVPLLDVHKVKVIGTAET